MKKENRDLKFFNIIKLVLLLLFSGIMMLCYGIITRFYFTPIYYFGTKKFKRQTFGLAIYLWGKILTGMTTFLLGTKFIIKGEFPTDTSYIILSNHQSLVDIPFILSAVKDNRVSLFVMKKALKWGYPGLSPFVRLSHFPFIDFTHGVRRDLIFELQKMAKNIKAGYNGILFPEGKREFDGELQNFKIGGLKFLIRESDVPVVPVTIEGAWKSAKLKDFFRYLPGSTIYMIIGDRIDTARYKKEDKYLELLMDVKNVISANLDELRR